VLLPPSQIAIKDDESRQEGKLNRKLVVMLKIVVFAPIPSARQEIAVSAKPGFAPERPGGVAQIGGEILQPAELPDVMRIFGNPHLWAEFTLRAREGLLMPNAHLLQL